MSKNVPLLCGAKTAASLFAAVTGSPLQLEPTPGCSCPVCAGIIQSRQLAGHIGKIQATPAGIATALNGMARHQAEQNQPITELKQGSDGVYR